MQFQGLKEQILQNERMRLSLPFPSISLLPFKEKECKLKFKVTLNDWLLQEHDTNNGRTCAVHLSRHF